MSDDEYEPMSPEAARDWLAEWLEGEADWDPEDSRRVAWFVALGRHVRTLPADDRRLQESA
jgi:hypothetical protein